MQLLERRPFLEALDECLAAARAGAGRLVLLAGEAGIGKSVLARSFCERHAGDARVLWGACDVLHTPRPLGPLLDIAREAGGELGRLSRHGASRETLFTALLDTLRNGDGLTLRWLSRLL